MPVRQLNKGGIFKLGALFFAAGKNFFHPPVCVDIFFEAWYNNIRKLV